MPLNIESLVKLAPIPGVIVRDPQTGKPAVAPIRSDAVLDASGKTVDQMLASAVAAAVEGLQTGDIKTLSDALDLLKGSVDTFLTGEPDAGAIDRLSELVAAIQSNKDTVDALLTDKVDKSAIYDGLDSTDATKVLSAAQGKALKTLIDGIHTHANQANVLDKLTAVDGKLKFNGTDVGETRAWVSTVNDVPAEWPADVHPGGVIFLVASEAAPTA